MNKDNSNSNYKVKSVFMSKMETPKLVESKVDEANIILNGQNHKYVKFLTDLYTKSATHRAMITTKANLTAGHKVTFNQNLSTEDVAILNNFFNNVNNQGDNIHDVVSSLALDYYIFGYCFIQIGYNKLKQVNYIDHIDASTIALGKVNDKGLIEDFYFSNDWSNFRKAENKPVQLKAFNPDNIQPGKTQILMIKKKEPGLIYYSNPPYDQTTQTYSLAEYDLSQFHLNNANSGFFPSAIITHFEPGLNENQMDDIIEGFEAIYTGTKQKKIVHVFPGDKELAPKVDSFPSNDDDNKFIELNRIIESKIAVGHNIVNKALAGLTNDAGVLGDLTSIQASFELLYKIHIQPVQNLIEKALNKVLKHKVEGVNINIITNSPLQFKGFSENILSQVMTQTELRKELNLPPLQNGEKTNLDTVRENNPDLNNGQAVYPNSILEQDQANN